MVNKRISGVIAAAVTPLSPDYHPDLDAIPEYLTHLAERGCHGVLLMGTTGEGPSFSPEERLSVFRAALAIRETHPDFVLLAGTGTPSLQETILLNKGAFELDFDGVVVLPPFYYRSASDEGLFNWFSQVIQQSIPEGGVLFGYHIPRVSGVGLSLELLSRLKDAFPSKFAGLKNSASEPEFAQALGERFGSDLIIFPGHEKLAMLSLEAGASGFITAAANINSPIQRRLWDAFQSGKRDEDAQESMARTRAIMDVFEAFPALVKALMARQHGFPYWPVRPPLTPFSEEKVDRAEQEIYTLINSIV